MGGDGRTRDGVGGRDRAGSPPLEARIPSFAPRGPSSRPLRLRWIVILGSLAGLPPLAIDLYLPALPSLTHGLHASASTGQLTLTGFVAGLAAGQLVAGALSDAHGRRVPLLLGLIGYVTATALCAAAPDVWALVVLRVIAGATGGAGVVIGRAIVRDTCSGTAAARVFALMMLVTGSAPVIAPLVGGQLLVVTDWRGLFVALAALGVVQLAAVVLVLHETLPAPQRHGGEVRLMLARFRRLLANSRFAADAGSLSLSFGAFFAYVSASSFLLEDVYHASPQLFSLIFALLAAVFVVSAQVGGRLVERVGARALFANGLAVMAASSVGALAVIATGAGLGALIACLVLVNVANGLVWPNGTAVAMDEAGAMAGSASALMGVGQFGLGAVVAPLVGVAGSRAALPTGIVMGACGLGAWLLYQRGTTIRVR
jgi:DHA1 family bicyclomycin/chloramphenicol resistance-like MFS transporter